MDEVDTLLWTNMVNEDNGNAPWEEEEVVVRMRATSCC